RVFTACVQQLEYSFELWADAKQTSGAASEALLEAREEVLAEVTDSLKHLTQIVKEFHTFAINRGGHELAKLRKEMDSAMNIARGAEDRQAGVSAAEAERRERYKQYVE